MLDMKKVRQFGESLEKGNFKDIFMDQSKLQKGETHIRILPPSPQMEGIYAVPSYSYWIAGKPYLSNKTFGKLCVIDEEVKAARIKSERNKDLESLLSDRNNLKYEERNCIPVLLLEPKFKGTSFEVSSCAVADVKILRAGKMLTLEINRQVSSRTVQNGTEDGCMDRVLGYNLMLTKTGEKLTTAYRVEAWSYPLEMPENYYDFTGGLYPDIFAELKKRQKSDEYLRSVIRNYLYGEEILEEESNSKNTPIDRFDSIDRAPVGKVRSASFEDVPKRESGAGMSVSAQESPSRKRGLSKLADLNDE